VELSSARARPNAFHTVLLLVESRTDNLEEAVIQSNVLKNYGIKIVPIAVGPDVPLDELRKMATNPLDVELIPYDQIGSMNYIQQLIPKLCPSPSEYCVLYVASTLYVVAITIQVQHAHAASLTERNNRLALSLSYRVPHFGLF